MTTDKISFEELQRLLADPDTPEAELAPYFTLDPESGPFAPRVIVNPETVIIPTDPADGSRSALIMNGANWIARSLRQARCHQRLLDSGYNGPVIVDEGDSWFQYPFLLHDTIDVLMEDLAVFSLSAGGDTIGNMARRAEYRRPLADTGASMLLLSAGGNDLVADGELARHLRDHVPGMSPADHLLPSFDRIVARAIADYTRIFDDLTARFPDVDVICHGYDRPIPSDGPWLGTPMASRGIDDRSIQAEIAGLMIDRFNDQLTRLIPRYPKVHHLDLRGVVDGRWKDELHPTDDGYRDVADRFRDKIDELSPAGTGTRSATSSARVAAADPVKPQARSLHIGVNVVDPGHYGSEMALEFCVADCEAMEELATERGYTTEQLTDGKATRDAVIDAVGRAAAELGDGDLFLFTYAGHGSQLPDINKDEQGGPDGDILDETLCLFDGQLVDDELYELWSQFADGVRIVAVFDCCHSGSVVRAGSPRFGQPDASTGRPRLLTMRQSTKVYKANRDFYDEILSRRPAGAATAVREIDRPVRASLIQLSACQSNQLARESFGHGLFTARLLDTLDRDGRWQGYRDFLDAASDGMPADQTPKYWAIGVPDPVFEASQPFQP